MKYSEFLHNLDIERIKELVIIKLQYFFNDAKVAKIILFFSLALLLWQTCLIYSLYYNYKNWQLPDVEQIYRANSQSKPNNTLVIVNKHIFGALARPGGSLADAVKTALPLVLKGVIANSADSKLGQAIIQGGDGKQKVYAAGDQLKGVSGHVVLEYIYREKVYIKNNGRLEYILYPILDLSTLSGKSDKNIFRSGNSGIINKNLPQQTIFGAEPNEQAVTVPVPAPVVSQEDDEEQEADERSDLPNSNNLMNNSRVDSLNKRLRNQPKGSNNPDRINNQIKRIYN